MVGIFEFKSSTVVLEKYCKCTILCVSDVKKAWMAGRNAVFVLVPPITVCGHPSHNLFS